MKKIGKSHTPLNPLLIDGTSREKSYSASNKKWLGGVWEPLNYSTNEEKSHTPLNPLLIEGTLREKMLGKDNTIAILLNIKLTNINI